MSHRWHAGCTAHCPAAAPNGSLQDGKVVHTVEGVQAPQLTQAITSLATGAAVTA